jgi:nitric oxide dioxygenase
MSLPLTPETIAIIKATVPALRQHGLAITKAMYAHLFQVESIRHLFDQGRHGEGAAQPKALAAAILRYAENIDNLGALAPLVGHIVQRHVATNIKPEHYPYVAKALLSAIRDVLEEAATDDVLEAWGQAYWTVADILISKEAEAYATPAAA